MPHIDAKRLKLVMELRGMTNEELAAKVDTSSEYVSLMRSGKRTLSRNPVLRRRIADALGVDVDWIEAKEQR